MDEPTILPPVEGQEPCGEMGNTVSQSYSTDLSSFGDSVSQDSAEGNNIYESQPTTQSTDDSGSGLALEFAEQEELSVSGIPNGSPDEPKQESFVKPSSQEVVCGILEQDDGVAHTLSEDAPNEFLPAPSLEPKSPEIENAIPEEELNVGQSAPEIGNIKPRLAQHEAGSLVSNSARSLETSKQTFSEDGTLLNDGTGVCVYEDRSPSHASGMNLNDFFTYPQLTTIEPPQTSSNSPSEASLPTPSRGPDIFDFNSMTGEQVRAFVEEANLKLGDERTHFLGDPNFVFGQESPVRSSSNPYSSEVFSDLNSDIFSPLPMELSLSNEFAAERPNIQTACSNLTPNSELTTPLDASSYNDNPQEIKEEPSLDDFQESYFHVPKTGSGQPGDPWDLDEDLDEDSSISVNTGFFDLDPDRMDLDSDNDEDRNSLFLPGNQKISRAGPSQEHTTQRRPTTQQLQGNSSEKSRGIQQKIPERFPQTKPNPPQKSTQVINENINLNNNLRIVLAQEVNDEIAEDSGDDVLNDDRNPANKNRQRVAKIEGQKSSHESSKDKKKESKLLSTPRDLTESDDEQIEEPCDESYEPGNISNNKRKYDGNSGPSNSKKPRKSFGPRANTPREWWAKERLRHPVTLTGRAWKEEVMRVNSLKFSKPDGSSMDVAEDIFDPTVFLGGSAKSSKPSTKSKFTHSLFDENEGDGDEGGEDGGDEDEDDAVPIAQRLAREVLFDICREQHDIHKLRKTIKDIQQDSRTFGYGQVTMVRKGKKVLWRKKGMPTDLLSSQLVGAVHMVKRECGTEAPFGALVADAMGTGKTLQAIATIIANPPSADQIAKGEGTTLIVTPSSVKSQWFAEILLHGGKAGQSVITYVSSRQDATDTTYTNNNIVATTFWELARSLPNPDKKTVELWEKQAAQKPKKGQKKFDIYAAYSKWVEDHQEERGMLHRVKWYRVIIDEAHYIKNHLSRTSRAAVALKYDHPQLLSATPIMNRFMEFYALLRFMQEPITSELTPSKFESKFCNLNDPECTLNLGAILSDFIIHRKKSDKILNQEIVPLKPADKRDHLIKQHPALRLIMSAIELRFKELSTMEFKKGDLRASLRNSLTQLLRLRQGIANIDLIGLQCIVIFEVKEMKEMQKKIKEMCVRDKRALPNVLCDRISQWIKCKESGAYKSFESDELECCAFCQQASEDLIRIRCTHKLCDVCLGQTISEAIADEDGEDVMQCPVPKCPKSKKIFQECDIKRPKATEPKAESANSKSKSQYKSGFRGKDFRGYRPVGNQPWMRYWLQEFDDGKIKHILPSDKLNAITEQIEHWLKSKPGDKIIVFAQFRHFQVILGIVLQKLKINFLYFSGCMTQAARTKAIQEFKKEPKIQVMVAGLQCGGVGLNLNFANRVIISDLWWNSSIDDQAFGRVHRYGLKKTAFLRRIVVSDTVDTALLEMQEIKSQAIGNVMKGPLTEEKLLRALGRHKWIDDINVDELIANFNPEETEEVPEDGIDDDENQEPESDEGEEIIEIDPENSDSD